MSRLREWHEPGSAGGMGGGGEGVKDMIKFSQLPLLRPYLYL